MNGPYLGWLRLASFSATLVRAGSSPTVFIQSSIVSGVVRNFRNFTEASSLAPVALVVMPLTQYDAKFDLMPLRDGSSVTPYSRPFWLSSAPRRNDPSMVIAALPERNAVTPSVRKPICPTLCLSTRSMYHCVAAMPAGLLYATVFLSAEYGSPPN